MSRLHHQNAKNRRVWNVSNAAKKYDVRKKALKRDARVGLEDGVGVTGSWGGFWRKVKRPDYKGMFSSFGGGGIAYKTNSMAFSPQASYTD
jgi:hypothetical protein